MPLQGPAEILLFLSRAASSDPAGALCVVIAVVSLLALVQRRLLSTLALRFDDQASPLRWVNRSLRCLSYGFVHGGILHLACNLPGLYLTMHLLAPLTGWMWAMGVFLAGVAVPGFVVWAWTPLRLKGVTIYVGASGGVFAVLATLIMIAPGIRFLLFYFINIPGLIFIWATLALSVIFHFGGTLKSIWHMGHAVGIVTGMLLAMYVPVDQGALKRGGRPGEGVDRPFQRIPLYISEPEVQDTSGSFLIPGGRVHYEIAKNTLGHNGDCSPQHHNRPGVF